MSSMVCLEVNLSLESNLVEGELGAEDVLSISVDSHGDPIEALENGEEHLVEYSHSRGWLRGATRARLVMPGSFNPIHVVRSLNPKPQTLNPKP